MSLGPEPVRLRTADDIVLSADYYTDVSGGPAYLLGHGFTGSSRSPHVLRIAGQLNQIGASVLAAAHSFLVNDRLVTGGRPIMQELATETGLTCSLYERVGYDRILVARVDGLGRAAGDHRAGPRRRRRGAADPR